MSKIDSQKPDSTELLSPEDLDKVNETITELEKFLVEDQKANYPATEFPPETVVFRILSKTGFNKISQLMVSEPDKTKPALAEKIATILSWELELVVDAMSDTPSKYTHKDPQNPQHDEILKESLREYFLDHAKFKRQAREFTNAAERDVTAAFEKIKLALDQFKESTRRDQN